MINPIAKLKELFWEHEEVIKLRQQFSELDGKTQSYVVMGSFGLSVLILLGLLISLFAATHSVHSQMAELNDSINYLSRSSDKMDELHLKIRAQSASSDDMELDAQTALNEVAEKVAGKSAIGKDSLEIPEGAPAGSSLTLKLNKISLRQLTRFFFYLENSKASASAQHLLVETRDDPEGYLWAALTLVREIAKPGKTK